MYIWIDLKFTSIKIKCALFKLYYVTISYYSLKTRYSIFIFISVNMKTVAYLHSEYISNYNLSNYYTYYLIDIWNMFYHLKIMKKKCTGGTFITILKSTKFYKILSNSFWEILFLSKLKKVLKTRVVYVFTRQ